MGKLQKVFDEIDESKTPASKKYHANAQPVTKICRLGLSHFGKNCLHDYGSHKTEYRRTVAKYCMSKKCKMIYFELVYLSFRNYDQ